MMSGKEVTVTTDSGSKHYRVDGDTVQERKSGLFCDSYVTIGNAKDRDDQIAIIKEHAGGRVDKVEIK